MAREQDRNTTNINWFPGHMTKAFRELEDKLKNIDVVVEVLDARAPRSTRNPDFEKLFRGKRRIIVLNKEDLADRETTSAWVDYFRKQELMALSYSVIRSKTSKPVLKAIEDVSMDIISRYSEKGVKKTIRVLVCGIPNVGKSALLNKLLGVKKLKEGNKPGVTKGLSWVRINEQVECMDSPGLLWPKFEDKDVAHTIALIGSIRQEVLEDEELSYYLVDLLRKNNSKLITEKYDIEFDDDTPSLDIMYMIGKRRGFLLRGGEIDLDRTSKLILDEFKNGKMGVFSFERPEDI